MTDSPYKGKGKGSNPASKKALRRYTPNPSDEVREQNRLGGFNSQKVQAEKRNLQAVVQAMLNSIVPGTNVTVREAIVQTAARDAIEGDDKARRFMGEYSGEKPQEKNEDILDIASILLAARRRSGVPFNENQSD